MTVGIPTCHENELAERTTVTMTRVGHPDRMTPPQQPNNKATPADVATNTMTVIFVIVAICLGIPLTLCLGSLLLSSCGAVLPP